MTFRKSPPDIEAILELSERPLDAEYDLAGTLGGIRGTWHRLWSLLSTQESKLFGTDQEAIARYEEGVVTVRQEFEGKFGRALSDEEFDKLKKDAQIHGAAVKAHYSGLN